MTRRYLTDAERHAMLERQGGLCASWGCTSEGPFDADHSNPAALAGGKPDQLLCKACHRKKTFGLRGDLSNIAKAKRIGDGRTQYDKRKQKGPQLKSRGFQGWRDFAGALRFKKERGR